MQFPIIIGLHRSRFLDAMLLLTALLASTAILGFECSLSIRAGLFFSVLALATLVWRGLTPAVTNIRLERNGEIFIVRAGETDFCQATLKPGATVHPWLTVVRLTTEDGRCTVLLAAVDSQNKADFRRLRVFLRWQANFSGSNDLDV